MSKEKIKVVALGDSITYGFPYDPSCSWVNIASDLLQIEIINEGVCGDTTSFMLYRFYQSVIHYNSTHVIIMGGVNDTFCKISPDTVYKNIVKMCNRAKEYGILPVIGLPTPVNEYPFEETLKEYRDRMKDYAETKNLKVIDFYQSIMDPETGGIRQGYHVDGVHPSIDGYEAMSLAVKIHHFI